MEQRTKTSTEETIAGCRITERDRMLSDPSTTNVISETSEKLMEANEALARGEKPPADLVARVQELLVQRQDAVLAINSVIIPREVRIN